MLKTLILTQKSNQSDFRRKLWLFYVCMMFVMRKTQINLNRFVLWILVILLIYFINLFIYFILFIYYFFLSFKFWHFFLNDLPNNRITWWKNLMTFKCNYQSFMVFSIHFFEQKCFTHFINNHKVWLLFQSAYLKRMKVNVRLIYSQMPCVCRKNVAIEMSYFPSFHERLLILTWQLQEYRCCWYQLHKIEF